MHPGLLLDKDHVITRRSTGFVVEFFFIFLKENTSCQKIATAQFLNHKLVSFLYRCCLVYFILKR